MAQLTTSYHPAALRAGYRPVGAWPFALTVVLLATAAARPALARPAHYAGAAYRPQPTRLPLASAPETPFSETQLAARPVRSYRVKAKVRQVRRGRLHL